MFSKHRLEGLSDAIFAIVKTLLVLDLKVPENVAAGGLLHALAHDSATWGSFVLTFVLAAIFWTLQHQVFDLLDGITHGTLIPTFIFLGFIAILPFSTALLGHHPEPLSFLLYFLNQFAIAASLAVKLEVSRALNHVHAGFAMNTMRARLYSMCVIMGGSVLAPVVLSSRRMWLVPLVLVFGTRMVRYRLARRWKQQGLPVATA